ncbi:MAG TPA: aminotransferase class I/II-fold pyridoxal phosphate-dependent enzyme, partial [Anaeromyxobacteraceae bacterium]
MPDRLGWIAGELTALGRAGPRRELDSTGEAQGPVVEVDGRRLVNLCSDDYLGLASDPRTWRAAAEAAGRAGAARPVAGDPAPHRELERRLAELAGTEAALLLSSGWHANAGVPAALVGPGDAVFSDELNHVSIADGCRLSRAEVRRYRHGDAEDLGRLLASTRARRKLV